MSLKVFISCLFFLWGLSLVCRGQTVKLNKISKITFTTAGSFISRYYREVQVMPENGRWNSYRTKLAESRIGKSDIRDSSVTLVKAVSPKIINQLLTTIASPDTALNLKLFHITSNELIQHIDSLAADFKDELKWSPSDIDSIDINLTEAQKAQFAKIIRTEPAEVKNAALTALNPFRLDDRTYYSIIISYKNLKQDTISAYAKLELYHLPWRINKHYNYNPRLAELFELLSGDENFIAKEHNRLYAEMSRLLYQKRVKPQIVWTKFKEKRPASYATLNHTLSPSYILSRNTTGFLTSSLLPADFEMWFRFMPDGTLNTAEYNMMENYMLDFYHKRNFLVDYIRTRPTYVGRFYAKMVTRRTIDQIKIIYPDIAKFEPDQIQLLSVMGDCYQSFNFDKRSNWLLLPDGVALLISYTNNIIKTNTNSFAGFTDRSRFHSQHHVCIVYDKVGHKIAGDYSPVRIEVN